MEEVILVNPENPFKRELISRAWEIAKAMPGFVSPAKTPEKWKQAFHQAMEEIEDGWRAWGPGEYKRALAEAYNPVWVKPYTRVFRGKEYDIAAYPRLTPTESRMIGGRLHPEYKRRRREILEMFTTLHPTYEDWVAAGKPRESHLVRPVNPWAPGTGEAIWARFKELGGRSPALDPELWRQAFREARAAGEVKWVPWTNPPELFYNPYELPVVGDISRYFYGVGWEDVAAGAAGLIAAGYIPKYFKLKGWQLIIADLLIATLGGSLLHSLFRGRLPVQMFVAGALIKTAFDLVAVLTGGKYTPITYIAGEEEEVEEEELELLLGEEEIFPEEEELLLGEEEEIFPEEEELLLGEELGEEEKEVEELIL